MLSSNVTRLAVFLAFLGLGAGLRAYLNDRGGEAEEGFTGHAAPCAEEEDPRCRSEAPSGARSPDREHAVIRADDACRRAGYLCAALEEQSELRIVRFAEDTRILIVRVPLPEHEDPGVARRLRRAAVRGIQTWQGHPFQLRILERDRGQEVDMEVRWTSSLGGATLGRTRSQYRSGPGGIEYRVVDLTLGTRSPRFGRNVLRPATVELTAAHEMGHALGLPHSDDRRDLMYSENTATHPTARDYRTVEALYALPVGARVRR